MNLTRPRVYLETSVVSYLVARPSRDVVLRGNSGCLQSNQNPLDQESLTKTVVERSERLHPVREVSLKST